MLESIYNIGGGKQASPLARYLSSVGGAAGGAGDVTSRALGGQQTQLSGVNIGQNGSPTPPPSGLSTGGLPGGAPGPAGSAPNPFGAGLPQQSFDYSSDPVLQQMLAGGAQDEATADAQALGARRSVLGQYGDRGLAESVLGTNDPTLDSISDNPDTSTSTLARLKRSYGQTVHDSEEAMNQNNLFYGGARIKQLGDLAHGEQTQQADANAAVKQALDQIGATLGSTKAGIRNSRAGAEADAASRAAQAAILQALAGGGGGGGGWAPPPASGAVSGPSQAGTNLASLDVSLQQGDPGAAQQAASVLAGPPPDPNSPDYASWKLLQGQAARQQQLQALGYA